MAIQFINPAIGLTRITGLVQGSATNYSSICWFRPDVDIVLPDYQMVFALENFDGSEYQAVLGETTDNYTMQLNNGGGLHTSTAKVLVAGKWYPIGYTKSGSSHLFYASGIVIGSLTLSMASVTFTNLFLGFDGFGLNKATFKGFREWTATLTAAQLLREFNSQDPVHLTGLVTNTPLVANLLDTTINNNDWTTSGIEGVDYNFIADDPIPAGCVASDAVDMGVLPYSTTIAVKPSDVEFLFDRWYKYTARAPEVYIGGWFFGNLTTYTANCIVYSDAGITEYPSPVSVRTQNQRFQMPVIVPHTYWFGVLAQFTDLSFSTLTIDFLTAPNEAVPAGSGFINEDQTPFYSAIFSGVPGDDNHILKFFPFVITSSEQGGDTFNNGSMIVNDDGVNLPKLFSSQLTFILTFPGITGGIGVYVRRTASGNSVYTNIQGGSSLVFKSDKDGNVGGTTWTPTPSITSIAVNDDETILYYVESTLTNRVLRRWDLVNNVALSNLAAGVTSYAIRDLLVLSDDTILAMYVSSPNMNILRYDPSGTLLNTYTIGDCDAGSIAFDFTDPDNYFLIRVQELAFTGSSSIIRIKLTDGTQVRSNYVVFTAGVYQAAITATPVAKFGVPSSCPFFPLVLSPNPPSGGIYKLVPNSSQYTPRRNDKLYLDVEAKTTEEVKIPDPFIESAAIGD